MAIAMSRFRRLLAALLLLAAWTVPAQAAAIAAPAEEAEAESAAEPATPLPLESPDPLIARRLAEIYSGVDGFAGVRARVRDGVVTLQGTALTVPDREEAQTIAERLDGVVAVENELVVEHRVDRRLQPVIARARQILHATLAFLPLLLVALTVFLAFWFLGKLLTRSTRLFRRLAPNPFIMSLVKQVIRLVFMLIGLVVAMSILGATALLGSVLGAAGLLGLAIGFAVRDTIENYIASILLSVRRPFAPNDHVIIEGYEGKITLLNSRATVITTFDGNEVRIPNATVYKANITNFSRSPERRFEFEIGVGYENDLTCALALALSTVKSVDGVLEDPAPFVQIERLDAYAVTIKAFGWADQVKSDYGKVRSEAIRQVKDAFDAAGISIPEPIQSIRWLAAPPAKEPDASPPAPTDQELQEIYDTGPDHTLSKKVQEVRSNEDDLLTRGGARE
jgi:small-conductance mechanosensitive channel